MISNQLIEGGVDSSLFENFLYHTLEHVSKDQQLGDKQIVLLLDNAAIHKHDIVLKTALKFNTIVLFNAEYSPQLNPIE